MEKERIVISDVRSVLENDLDMPVVHVKQEPRDAEIEGDGDSKFSSQEPDYSFKPFLNVPGVIKIESVSYRDEVYEPNSISKNRESNSVLSNSSYYYSEVCYIKEEPEGFGKDLYDENESSDLVNADSNKQEKNFLLFNKNDTFKKNEEKAGSGNQFADFKARLNKKFHLILNPSAQVESNYQLNPSAQLQSNHQFNPSCQSNSDGHSEEKPLKSGKTFTTFTTPLESAICNKNYIKEETPQNHSFTHSTEEPVKSQFTEKINFCPAPIEMHGHKWDTIYGLTHKCNLCEKIFNNKSELKKHSVIHKEKKRFKCSECPSTFSRMKFLISHSFFHKGEKPYKCNKCDKAFTGKFYLDAHSIIHEEKSFTCTDCGKNFGNANAFKRHMFRHSGEKPYKCNDCGRTFKDNSALGKHLFVHASEKPFKCHKCGKAYAQKGGLRNHLLIHTGETPFKCGVCGEGFRNNASLKSHSFIHTGDFPFKCKECGKAYRDNTTLKRHFVKHAVDNPYKCHLCDKTLNGRNNLKNHLLIHSGEQPYQCNECGRFFRSKSSLKEHLFRIHQLGKGSARALASTRRYKKVIEDCCESEEKFFKEVKVKEECIKVEVETDDFEIEEQPVQVKIEAEDENEMGDGIGIEEIKEDSTFKLPVIDVTF